MNNVTIYWSGKENLKGSTFKETVVAVFKEREVAKEFVYALRVSANILEHRNAYIAVVFTNYREYTEVAMVLADFFGAVELSATDTERHTLKWFETPVEVVLDVVYRTVKLVEMG